MKKMIAAAMITLLTIGTLAGCGTTGNTSQAADVSANNASQNTADSTSKNTESTVNANTSGSAGSQTVSDATDTTDIGSDEALKIALKDAGLSESEITELRVSTDYDHGRLTYEVDFRKDSTEYDYEILASTGEIISRDQEAKDSKQETYSSQTGAQITLEEAKQLALDRVPGATEQNLKIELDYDDGYSIYEGEIKYNQTEYEFEIDASTGNFLEWSEERH